MPEPAIAGTNVVGLTEHPEIVEFTRARLSRRKLGIVGGENLAHIADRPEFIENCSLRKAGGPIHTPTYLAVRNAVANILYYATSTVFIYLPSYEVALGRKNRFPILEDKIIRGLQYDFLARDGTELHVIIGRDRLIYVGEEGVRAPLPERPCSRSRSPSQYSSLHPTVDFVVADAASWWMFDPEGAARKPGGLANFKGPSVGYRLVDLFLKAARDFTVAHRDRL